MSIVKKSFLLTALISTSVVASDDTKAAGQNECDAKELDALITEAREKVQKLQEKPMVPLAPSGICLTSLTSEDVLVKDLERARHRCDRLEQQVEFEVARLHVSNLLHKKVLLENRALIARIALLEKELKLASVSSTQNPDASCKCRMLRE